MEHDITSEEFLKILTEMAGNWCIFTASINTRENVKTYI